MIRLAHFQSMVFVVFLVYLLLLFLIRCNLQAQLIGAGAIFVWVFCASGIIWWGLKQGFGLRISKNKSVWAWMFMTAE